MVVQKLLAEYPYNTVGNLLRFYKAYKSSGEPLTTFYKKHNATLTRGQHTCVGLGLKLLERLNSIYPHLAGKFFIASSEEAVEELPLYLGRPPWDPHDVTEKEHVLVACRIRVGKREGVFLLDPGYHVARVVTVMSDSNYPHTGWFRHTEETWVKRDYCYRFPETTSDYVLWEIKETRPNKTPQVTVNAVFVGSHYHSAVAVTEKRNFVYIYRSLLARNTKGEVTSGVHFPVDHLSSDPSVNVIYANSKGVKTRGRIPFKAVFCQELTVEQKDMLRSVEEELGDIDLMETLKKTSELLGDRQFVDSLRLINCSINIVGT
uniref:64 kDa protein n=1 Tax=Lygus hesperus TaxID=30085 RepID=A0A0A9XRV8_LYGHE